VNVPGNQLCVRDSAANEVVAQQRLKVMEASAFIDCDLHHGLPQGAIRKKVNGAIDRTHRGAFDEQHGPLTLTLSLVDQGDRPRRIESRGLSVIDALLLFAGPRCAVIDGMEVRV